MSYFRLLPILLLLAHAESKSCSLTMNIELSPLSRHWQTVDCALPSNLDSSALSFQTQAPSLEPVPASVQVGFFILQLPENCWKDEESCDWFSLGLGKKAPSGDYWCCSQEAIDLRLCGEEEEGHMLLDQSIFSGHHVIVDETKNKNVQIRKYGKDLPSEHNIYMLTYNCHKERKLQVTGEFDWPYHDTLDDDDADNMSTFESSGVSKANTTTTASAVQNPRTGSVSESNIIYETRSQTKVSGCCATLSNPFGLVGAICFTGMTILLYIRYQSKKVASDLPRYHPSGLQLLQDQDGQLQLVLKGEYMDDVELVEAPQEVSL